MVARGKIASEDTEPASAKWSIDRRVPLALIIAGLAQFGTFCAGGAVLYVTVTAHTERLVHLEATGVENASALRLLQLSNTELLSRLAHQEATAVENSASLRGLTVGVARIEERLGYVLERSPLKRP